MRIVLLGPPGSGKGTQAPRISTKYNAPHISTGDIFRDALREGTPLGLEAKKYMDAGDLVPDEVVVGIVRERIAQDDCRGGGFVLDGFPRTVAQAEALDDMLDEKGQSLDTVIDVDVGREELIRRLTARRSCAQCRTVYNLLFQPPEKDGVCDQCGGPLVQRDDDKRATVETRLDVYQKETAPLTSYYRQKGKLKPIRGEGSVEAIFEDIVATLGQPG